MKKVLLGLFFCQISLASTDFPSTLNQEEYRKLYPLSVKYCAMTKVHRKGEAAGGAFAHAVLYFDNACVDTKFGYPQIRKCNPGEKQGVGVSVNKVFKNVNWVALPSRELFFYGNLKDSEVLDAEAKGGTVSASQTRNDLISQVAAMGIYQGIEIKDKVAETRTKGEDETRFKINQSLDTDFAINWGRDIYCVNVPLNENLLDKGIEFVNLANIVHADAPRLKDYKLQSLKHRDLKGINIYNDKAPPTESADEYNWNGVSENCAHLAYNLFAAMGLVAPRRIGIKIPNPFTMAVPADRWVSLIGKANADFGKAVDEVYDLYQATREHNVLDEQKVIVKHHGVIAEGIAGHNAANNKLFIRETKLRALWPLHWWPTHNYSVNRPSEIYDIKENLLRFDTEYTRLLSELDVPVLITPDQMKFLQGKPNMDRFLKTVESYKEAVRTAQKQAREKLEILGTQGAAD